MQAMIDLFRASEIPVDIRIRAIRKLSYALDFQYASNWSGEVAEELIAILEGKKGHAHE